jgi:hypothetical protein
MTNLRHKTAIVRYSLSLPMRRLFKEQKLKGRLLDYGCGRGYDATTLNMTGYDPHYAPAKPLGQFDTITCNYVLNVIESRSERDAVLETIRKKLKPEGKAYISVRNDLTNLKGYTKIGTWQGKIELDLPILYKNSGFITYVLEK